MKRLTAVINRGGCDALAKKLVWLSCVDVDVSPSFEEQLERNDTASEKEAIEKNLALSDAAHDLLSGRSTVKGKLFAPKPELARGEGDAERIANAEELIRAACSIEDKISELKSERGALATELEALLPWRGYDLPLSFAGTAGTEVFLGSLAPGTDANAFFDEIEEAKGIAATLLYSNVIDGVTYVACLVHKSESGALLRELSSVGFVKSPVLKLNATAEAAGQKLENKIIEYDEKVAELYRRADELAEYIDEVEYYSDTERARLSYVEAKSRMATTDYTAVLTGWVPVSAEADVVAELMAVEAAYELREPAEDEEVPVLLKNNRFASAFEPVVRLYSLPKYGTYDPTMVMSIFYLIIFALMFADVGYGLILLTGCLFGLRLMKPKGSLKKFLEMFAYCGVACMVTGIVFGGYFGDLPTKMAVNMFGAAEEADLSLWFNPVNDPMSFLIVSLAIGALHLVGALAVKFYVLACYGKWLDAIFDAGSWILVFLGAGVAIVGVVMGSVLSTVGLILVIAGYGILVLTQGRAEKSVVMKIGKGLLALYETINYVSDLLSYSRILSLGLASAVIASVFNLIGTMGGFSLGGILIFVVAVLIGHTLNIAINVLGSFVHTSRLQYIEFFGKFYEDGGRAFIPLEPMAKYHVYKENN